MRSFSDGLRGLCHPSRILILASATQFSHQTESNHRYKNIHNRHHRHFDANRTQLGLYRTTAVLSPPGVDVLELLVAEIYAHGRIQLYLDQRRSSEDEHDCGDAVQQQRHKSSNHELYQPIEHAFVAAVKPREQKRVHPTRSKQARLFRGYVRRSEEKGTSCETLQVRTPGRRAPALPPSSFAGRHARSQEAASCRSGILCRR